MNTSVYLVKIYSGVRLINLDELVFSSTGKHFNDLQRSILESVLNGQKYAEIEKNCHRAKGHIKNEAYKLWQLLSKTLNEDINKHNFKATIQRIISRNYNLFGNPVQIGNEINLCHNLGENKEEIKDDINNEKDRIKSIQSDRFLNDFSERGEHEVVLCDRF